MKIIRLNLTPPTREPQKPRAEMEPWNIGWRCLDEPDGRAARIRGEWVIEGARGARHFSPAPVTLNPYAERPAPVVLPAVATPALPASAAARPTRMLHSAIRDRLKGALGW